MAVIRCCGFEWGSVSELDYCDASISTAQKRSGTYSLYTYGSQGQLYFTASNEIYFQTAVYFTGFVTDSPILLLTGETHSDNILSVSTSASNQLKFYVGDVAAPWIPACTTNISLGINSWYLLEIHAKVDSVAGFIEARINGLTECTFYGNTKPATAAAFDGATFQAVSFSAGKYWDDIIIHDTTGATNNSWVSGNRIVLLRPTAAGSITGWTASAGSNYQCVDEVPPSSTDYVKSSYAMQQDLYNAGDLPAAAYSVEYIRSDLWLQKIAGSTTSQIQHAIKPPQGTTFSAVKEVATSWTLLKEGYEVNPQTTLAWTVSDVNALEIGMRSA